MPLLNDPDLLRACREKLSADELERADRYRDEAARRAFLISRSALRRLLSRCLGDGVAPGDLQFRYLPQGKPELDSMAGDGPSPWRFNVSHSGDLALIAIARDLEIGVDVEAARSVPDALPLARRFFSEAERTALERMPAEDREAAFLRGWTRKEAFLKAIGTGLANALDTFDVTLSADEPPRILAIQGKPAPDWRLLHLDLGTAHLGALAIPRIDVRVRGFTWT